MSKQKKKKAKQLKPPLSAIDKVIYFSGLFASFALALLMIFFFEDITFRIAFSDSSIVAFREHGSMLFIMPFVLYFFISAVIIFTNALTYKKPLFGNRKIKYGEHPWTKSTYPLFDKRRKSIYIKPSAKRFKRICFIAWCAFFLLTIFLIPLGLFGRDCLSYDNTITTYNVFNTKSNTIYTKDDFDSLILQIDHVIIPKGGSYWQYGMKIITTDNKTFYFTNRDFDFTKPDSEDTSLEKMAEIKALFSEDDITIKGAENIDIVSDFIGLNKRQTQSLYDLFHN